MLTSAKFIALGLEAPKGANVGQVLNRLHRHYCRPMTLRGSCAQECTSCLEFLKSITEASNRTDVRDPLGVIVWSCRDFLMNLHEKEKEPLEISTDFLGRPLEVNPLQEILARIELERQQG